VFALDTNTLIYFFKGAGRVGERLRNTSPREIGIPAVVLYELEVGVALSPQRENRRRALDAFLQVTQVLPLDEVAARAAATVRRTLERAGTTIGPLDTLIAGTALAHSAVLVTHNTRAFGRVSGLKLIDWL
jgi:tRNA(fMet)-specific endonuclease VapC